MSVNSIFNSTRNTLCILLIVFVNIFESHCGCNAPVFDILDTNKTIVKQHVSSECELAYKFEVPEDINKDKHMKIRIHMDTTKATGLECPVIFIIFQREQTFKIEVPSRNFQFKNATTFYRGGKTLCKPKPSAENKKTNISIHVNTCSGTPLEFNFNITLTRDLLLENGVNQTFSLGVMTPQYFIYRQPSRLSSRIINLLSTSDNDVCLTVSVQTPFCPIFDDIFDMEYPEGFFKTMTRSTVATIDTSHRSFTEGFAVVYAIHEDTSYCFDDKPHYIPESTHKTVTVLILDQENLEWTLLLICPVTFSLIIFTLTILGYTYHCSLINRHSRSENDITENTRQENANNGENSTANVNPTNSGMSTTQETQDDVKFSHPAKNVIMLSDFTTTNEDSHSKQFWQLLLLFGFYYASPVIQLVVILLMTLEKEGNYDTCFYNELCSAEWWIFHDFNHFYSNISYIIFGLLSIVIVKSRENAHVRGEYTKLNNDDVKRGIPRQCHLLLASAIAFCGEGLLSALYHLCPNKFTFQYDTSFMYVISILTLLHLFMARQPISFRPFIVFVYIFPFVAITIIAYLVDQSENLIIFCIFIALYVLMYFLTFTAFSIFYHDLGLLKDENGTVSEDSLKITKQRLQHSFCIQRHDHLRLIKNKCALPAAILFASVAIHVYYREKSITSQFLYVIVAATMFSIIHYMIQKMIYDKKDQKKHLVFPLLCFLLASIIGGVGVFEFLNTSYDANDSPAQSRAKNRPCEFLHYDHHDVWHMLSSASLFLTLMGLLTIDDGMATVKRSEITAF